MSEVLVLVDHVDGAVRKPTYELLTLARASASRPRSSSAAPTRPTPSPRRSKKYGAEKVYVVDDAEIKGYLVAPKAEALSSSPRRPSPGRGPDPVLRRGQGDRRPASRSSSAPA